MGVRLFTANIRRLEGSPPLLGTMPCAGFSYVSHGLERGSISVIALDLACKGLELRYEPVLRASGDLASRACLCSQSHREGL